MRLRPPLPLPLALIACVTLGSHADAQRRSDPAFSPGAATSPALPINLGEPLAHLLPADCDLDRTRGREAASSRHSSTGWMVGGFVSGIFLGLIGTAISYAMASGSSAEVEGMPEGVEPTCYRDGYTAKARGMNTGSALTGGLLGTAVLVLIVVSASSGSGY